MILDGDLFGRTVSETSRTYPEVAIGHMDDPPVVHLFLDITKLFGLRMKQITGIRDK